MKNYRKRVEYEKIEKKNEITGKGRQEAFKLDLPNTTSNYSSLITHSFIVNFKEFILSFQSVDSQRWLFPLSINFAK